MAIMLLIPCCFFDNKKGEQMKVQVNQNTRGFETMEKGRKVRGQDKFHVKLTDNQKRVYETKTSF